MPLKRLTWSKTRGTARECQPAARGCRPALHLAAAAAAALPCPAHSRGPDASPRPAAAQLHLRKPPRPPRQPQPGPAFEGRREPGAPRGWAGANPHLRLLLPSPPSPVRVLSGGVRGAQRPPNSAALAEASLAARVAYIRAPRSPHPLARATSCRRTPPPSGARAPAAAGLGRGRLFLAQLRREVGHQRARSPRDCADCGAPGGAGVTGRANQQQTPRPCRTLLIANSNNCMRDLEQVISISRKGLRALLWNYQLNRA